MKPMAIPLLKLVSSAIDVVIGRSCRSRDGMGGQWFDPGQPGTPVGWLASCRAATIIALGLVASPASATGNASPIGTWTTANGHGVIEIATCGGALCGRIVGIDRGPAEAIPTDVQGRSQCGLTILSNEKRATDGSWLGVVTDPRDGGTYQAKLWLDASGNLNLRGFIGIPQLGSTQTWHRFTGRLAAGCRVL